jgi:hypothetical protein
MSTSGFTTTGDDDRIMTGNEKFPVVGNAVTAVEITQVIQACAGLKFNWSCLPKSFKAKEVLGRGEIVIGSLFVTSGDEKSEYGFLYNPPLEMHSWLDLGDGLIFDIGLAGVIDTGLHSCDAIGPYLIDRKPVILAGVPMKWMRYKRHVGEDLYDFTLDGEVVHMDKR